jgi:hypothetical protein
MLLTHLAKHLEEVSLLALPRDVDNDDSSGYEPSDECESNQRQQKFSPGRHKQNEHSERSDELISFDGIIPSQASSSSIGLRDKGGRILEPSEGGHGRASREGQNKDPGNVVNSSGTGLMTFCLDPERMQRILALPPRKIEYIEKSAPRDKT